MIQANELRIGSKVLANGQHGGKIMTVDRIGPKEAHNAELSDEYRAIYFVEEPMYGAWLKDCNPIPLSTEILEAAGFERMAGFHQIDLSGENGIKWVGTLLDNETLSVGDAHDDAVSMRAPQYLHTLQNLFFALTGEELTVSPL